jgi:hypothetical protein
MNDGKILYGDTVNTPIGIGVVFGISHPSEPLEGYWVMHKYSEINQGDSEVPNLARGTFSKFHKKEDVTKATYLFLKAKEKKKRERK